MRWSAPWPRSIPLLGIVLLVGCGGPPSGAAAPNPSVVSVGERTEVAQVGLSVNSVDRRQLIGEASRPGEGNVFVLLAVTIENGTDHKIGYSRYQFRLKDGADRTYDPAAVPGQERPLLASELAPKTDISGTIAFRVPISAAPLELTYQPSGSAHPLRVNLGS